MVKEAEDEFDAKDFPGKRASTEAMGSVAVVDGLAKGVDELGGGAEGGLDVAAFVNVHGVGFGPWCRRCGVFVEVFDGPGVGDDVALEAPLGAEGGRS